MYFSVANANPKCFGNVRNIGVSFPYLPNPRYFKLANMFNPLFGAVKYRVGYSLCGVLILAKYNYPWALYRECVGKGAQRKEH